MERIFSIIKKIWKDERNRSLVDSVKAQLSIKLNFNMNCNEFYAFIKNNKELLSLVKSDKKYKHKNKD